MLRSQTSLSRRFIIALMSVVVVLVIIFAAIEMSISMSRVQAQLNQRLESVATLAARGLINPMWNLDYETVTSILKAALASEAIIYISVVNEDGKVFQQALPGFQDKALPFFEQSSKFLVTKLDIMRDEEPLGVLHIAISRENVQREVRLMAIAILVLIALLLAAIILTSILITRRYIAHPLSQLQQSAALIAGGDLQVPIDTTRKDEIGRLAQAFDTMRASVQGLIGALRESNIQLEDANQTLEQRVAERTAELAAANDEISALNEQLKAENLRMGAELEITRQLQQMILPAPEELEAITDLDIAGYMDPADEVGGDYYDVLASNGQVKIAIGDVTGHGLESGMVMLMTQMAVRTLLISGESDPVRFLDILNRTLYQNVQRMGTDKNLTLALLDYKNGQVRLSGQHEEMIVVRTGGSIELVDTVDLGFPIGLHDPIADFISYKTVNLNCGDGVVLYTDGITEAENAAGEQYGLERLCKVIHQHWGQAAACVREAVIQDVKRHIDNHVIYDDITLLVAKQL